MASVVPESTSGPDTKQVLSNDHPHTEIDGFLVPAWWVLMTTPLMGWYGDL